MKVKEERILIKDLPIITTLGHIGMNVSKTYKIMVAIHEGRTDDAFNLANEILEANDAIIEEQIDKEELMKLINKDRLKKN